MERRGRRRLDPRDRALRDRAPHARDDVRDELLVPSEKRTTCAYKGIASYHSVRVGDDVGEDLVWYYPEPTREAEPIRDLLSFFNEKVDVEVDGELEAKPTTQWS